MKKLRSGSAGTYDEGENKIVDLFSPKIADPENFDDDFRVDLFKDEDFEDEKPEETKTIDKITLVKAPSARTGSERPGIDRKTAESVDEVIREYERNNPDDSRNKAEQVREEKPEPVCVYRYDEGA